MPFLKSISVPNGATLEYHRIAQIEGRFPDPLIVTIAGYPNEQAYIDGKPPLWAHRITYDASGLLPNLEAAVLASPDFDGATQVGDGNTDLQGAISRRWAALKQWRNTVMYSPIECPGETFSLDVDVESQIKIMGAVMVMQQLGEATKMWRCSDNVMRELTLAQLFGVGAALAARTQKLIDDSDIVWQSLQAATTPAEAMAIQWPVESAPEPQEGEGEGNAEGGEGLGG